MQYDPLAPAPHRPDGLQDLLLAAYIVHGRHAPHLRSQGQLLLERWNLLVYGPALGIQADLPYMGALVRFQHPHELLLCIRAPFSAVPGMDPVGYDRARVVRGESPFVRSSDAGDVLL